MGDLIGQRLGQYEIVAILGRGGMATVYRARQVSVNREVAVKVISPDLAIDENFAVRFSREAQTIASLSHPHILKLFDFGHEDDVLYLVTELLPGGTLADLIRQGPVPLKRIDHLLEQIASALDYAHRQGIIHRDLKPQNILLDAHGNAFLTDFGIARLVAGSTGLTQTGSALGTPAYMSPEAWQAEEIDHRSDLYSLGIMLYEMLTGKLPFNSESPYKLMMAHISEMPPHVEALPEDLAPEFDALIQQTLAKLPADRPESAGAIADTVHTVVAGYQAGNVVRSTPSTLKLPVDTATPQASPTPQQANAASGSLAAAPARKFGLNPIVLVALAALIVVISAIAFIAGRPGASNAATPTVLPIADVIHVDPVGTDEFMILVAQPEQIGKQPRDVTRFIVNNLTETLDTSIPFSTLHVREYPKVITSAEQARAAANANNALVIVWGSVNDTIIDLQLQFGALTAIPHNKLPESMIRRYADVHVQMSDPLTESLAVPILVIIETAQSADGNIYEVFRGLSLLDQLKTSITSATVIGSGAAAQISRNELFFLSDTKKFIDQMDPIIALDSTNPLPYLYRNLGYLRNHQYDQALQDAETARKLAPEGWSSPLYTLVTTNFVNKTYGQGLPLADQIVQANPKDWYGLSVRASLNYFSGKLDAAKTDLDQARALSPRSSLAYLLAITVAIRQGRIADANAFAEVLRTKFPDSSFAERSFTVAFGDPATSKIVLGVMLSASANLFLGQYDKVVKQADLAIGVDSTQPDLFMVQGFAYCNLSKWAEAEKAYTSGLNLDSNYAALYALRAEVRNRQGNPLGALSDIQAMQKIKGSEELSAMVNAALGMGSTVSTGTPAPLSCQNFFSPGPATPAR